MTAEPTLISNDADVRTDMPENETSGIPELIRAARAVLREADARSESSHPMRYTCPWKQLTRLRRALQAFP